MIDWKDIFNIVFVAVSVALIMFLLISTIVVAVKGKRKCGAFDVILRIVSTLVFTAATCMFVCAVLSMVDGDFCIKTADAPVIVIGGKATELPMPALFRLLATSVGSEISAVLFVCSLVALICDCLVANKKVEKTSVNAEKAPVGMQAEIEKIRKLGDAAVKKAAVAAKSAERRATVSTEAKPDVNEDESEPVSDWREEQPTHADGFSGIKDEYDEFDSFDVDETSDESVSDEKYDESETSDVVNDGVESEDFDADTAEYDGYAEQADQSAEESDIEGERDVFGHANDGAAEPDAVFDGRDEDSYEPDRNIYIPDMRTIVRTERVEKPTVAEMTAKRGREKTGNTPKNGGKKQPGQKRNAQTSSKQQTDIPAEKKLPLTRRYIILDRQNAVNMFGEYLKERNKAEKDKLTSSLNTIIIE